MRSALPESLDEEPAVHQEREECFSILPNVSTKLSESVFVFTLFDECCLVF